MEGSPTSIVLKRGEKREREKRRGQKRRRKRERVGE
jgi:hypothetical protein